MRILHVADYYMPTMGYQESVLPRWHARHGHEAHVVTSDRYANVPDYAQSWGPLLGDRHVGVGTEVQDGVTIHRLAARGEVRNRIWLRGLSEAISEIVPDVIFGHGTTNYTQFSLASASRRMGIPLFLDCHMLFSVQDGSPVGRAYYAGMRSVVSRWIEPRVDRYYGVAQECCDFLERTQGIPPSKVKLLPLGLDTDVFQPQPERGKEVRDRLGVGESDLLVMQTGKMTRDKGPHLLAEALAPTMARDGRVHVAFVGGGSPDYLESVFAHFDSHGVRSRAHLLPFVDSLELAGHFTAADLVAFPAAASLSSIEAAGCGTAVLMTDQPAGRWREEQGIGTVFPDGNVDALRLAIERLLNSPEARKAMAEKARLAVESKFSYDKVARDLEDDMAEAMRQAKQAG